MTTNQVIENEAFLLIAQHYAEKIAASGITVTAESLEVAVKNNWNKIASDICNLSDAARAVI